MQTNNPPCENCGCKCSESNIVRCPKWKRWFIEAWENAGAQLKKQKQRKKTIYDHERSFFVYENPNVARQRMKDEDEQIEKEDGNA